MNNEHFEVIECQPKIENENFVENIFSQLQYLSNYTSANLIVLIISTYANAKLYIV
jgi:hypothetical protein